MSEHHDDNPGRRPPRGRPFQPGQSGNPAGRPKGALNFKTVMQKVMEKPTRVIEDGKEITMPRMEALWEKLSIMGLTGDLGALRLAVDHMARLEPSLEPGPAGGAVDLAAAAAIIAAHDQDVLAVHGVKPEPPDAG
jgi:hypothetical protein